MQYKFHKRNEARYSIILQFIKELAVYEKPSYEVIVTEEMLTQSLFGERKVAEVDNIIEDIYINPEYRGNRIGKRLFIHLAKLAKERIGLESKIYQSLQITRCKTNG